jgi:hypothetical protein
MTELIIVIAVVALVLLAGLGLWYYTRQRKDQDLRGKFGPEYHRTRAREGGKAEAEAELRRREKRVSKFHIRELTEDERVRFSKRWRAVQASFVDTPAESVLEADHLIGQVMAARGYPVDDFEERAADLSVNYPDLVKNYRSAHAVALSSRRGEAETEDLRQAFVEYRALFAELLETAGRQMEEARR